MFEFSRDRSHRIRRWGTAVFIVAASFAGASSSACAAQLTPVTTSALDTGPNSELVSSIPIYKTWEPSVEKVVYSLPIPSVRAGEILRATGNVELSGSHAYGVSASERLIIGSNPSGAEGVVVTPRANTSMTPEMSHLTLPIDGVYRPTADLGTQYLKLVVKAPALESKEGDTLTVVPDSGRLAVTRYAPTLGPTSLPTDELQSCATTSGQITTIPVDSSWHSALSCDLGEVSTEDQLELSGQMEIGNSNQPSVKLESLVIASTSPTGVEIGTNGYVLSDPATDTLTTNNRFTRIVQSNESSAHSASQRYVNLLVRATPVGEGTFTPLTIEPETAMLNVLRFKPKAGLSTYALLPGTYEHFYLDDLVDKSTVPFAAEDKTPVVVNSVAIDEMNKGEVLRAHGMLTANLNGGGAAPIKTELVLAETKTGTTGETVAKRSGDTIPTAQQIHTISKNVTFVATKSSAERQYLNLVVYASRAPAKEGEEMKVSNASVSYSRSKSAGSSTQLTPVTTSALDTGPNSELVSSIPIYKTWEPSVEKVVYSLPIPSVRAGEILRATGNVELSGSHAYGVSASERLIIGSNPSGAEGVVVTPRANTSMTPEMSHLTLPIDGVYRSTADLGTRYLKLIIKAPALLSGEGDTLTVVPNSGELAVTRYTPTNGPTSVPTDELQTCATASEKLTTIPVDSSWHPALSCDLGEVSTEDKLELSGQMEIGNSNQPNVKLESLVIASTTPSGAEVGTNGYILSDPATDILTTNNRFARIVQSNESSAHSASQHYVNLLVRATPTGEGTFTPLTIEPETAILNVLRFKPNADNPGNPMRPGTLEAGASDPFLDESSVPFVAEGKSPVVINSIPIYGPSKGDVIRVHGSVTANLNGNGSAPVETALILADTKSATTGEVVARRSGDTITASQRVHTINKNVTFSIPKSHVLDQYLNLVAYANRAPNEPGEALTLTQSLLSYSSSHPRVPFSDDFEDGSLDQFFQYGQTNSVTANQSREGVKAMQTDVNASSICDICSGGSPDAEGVRRAEILPPDRVTSGGFAGENRWYGWSVYFPDGFKTPAIDPSYFTGKIDEVRLYSTALSENQIKADQAGEYEKTGIAPVAAYPFDESKEEDEMDAITHDSSAGHHDGEIRGATWTGSGKYGSALEFDGLHSFVRVPDASALDLGKSFTLEAWVNPTDPTGIPRWWDPVIAKTEGEEHQASGYLLNAGFHHFPAGFVYDAGAEAVVGGFPEIAGEISELPTNAWSHLALTSDGEHLRLYVDGELKSTKRAIEAAPTGGDLTIGTNHFDPEVSSTWDGFTQWHHSEEGLGCSPDTSVPIGFDVARFPAGFRFQAGDTPVPATGEYIDVGFNGGQLEEVKEGQCHSVKPTERRILEPLHRGQWYDFVVHTRWTTEEGSSDNSITSVWINGRQVLGSQTTPVIKPTLYWKGSPEVHNSDMTWQWGLYRGPSEEDPPTRLFVDSVRTGESYAEVAPEIHAPRLEAESYPASLRGSGFATFSTSFGTFECGDTGLSGAMVGTARQVSLSAEYGECRAGKSGELSASVDMNSCHYTLGVDNAGPPYTGSLGVACESKGDAIEFKADEGGSSACTAKVGSQAQHGGLVLSNMGEGTQRGFTVSGSAQGVEYEAQGPGCGEGSALRKDGQLGGEAVVLGTGEGETAVGVHLTGDEFRPRVEAESYGAALKGTGLPKLQTSLGTFECTGTSLEGVAPNPTSELGLHAAYGECGITSGGTHYVASVKMNGCHYTLGVKEDVASPYAGTWGVACENAGEAIEYKLTKSASNCLKLKPQAGRDGVAFSKSGEGAGRKVGLSAEVKGLEYEWVGVCGKNVVRTDGVMSGASTLSASDESGAPIGAWLAGEP